MSSAASRSAVPVAVVSRVAEDVYLAISRLRTGSIILVTVDVEQPVPEAVPSKVKQYFISEVERYLPPRPRFAASQLPALNLAILERICGSAVSVREGVGFQPLFSFLYKDGHQMLTVGGMLVGEAERDLLDSRGLKEENPYMRFSFGDSPCNIESPASRERNGCSWKVDAGDRRMGT